VSADTARREHLGNALGTGTPWERLGYGSTLGTPVERLGHGNTFVRSLHHHPQQVAQRIHELEHHQRRAASLRRPGLEDSEDRDRRACSAISENLQNRPEEVKVRAEETSQVGSEFQAGEEERPFGWNKVGAGREGCREGEWGKGREEWLRDALMTRQRQRDMIALQTEAMLLADEMEDKWLSAIKPAALESKRRFQHARLHPAPPPHKPQLCYNGPAPNGLMSLARVAKDDTCVSPRDAGVCVCVCVFVCV